jgi:hypothetical protein
MALTWSALLSSVSPCVAVVSALYARRSARTASASLAVATITGEAAYEVARMSRTPAVSLLLTLVEYRASAGARKDYGTLAEADASNDGPEADGRYDRPEGGRDDSLEVVVQGRLRNNRSDEVIVTCADHPNSVRTYYATAGNESVFLIDGAQVNWQAILPGAQEVSFEWIDRRPRSDWIRLYELHGGMSVPVLTLLGLIRAIAIRSQLGFTRAQRERQSGFVLSCEPRATERVATIWRAEVIKAPVRTAGFDEHDRPVYINLTETVQGPFDDSVIKYRLDFGSNVTFLEPRGGQ